MAPFVADTCSEVAVESIPQSLKSLILLAISAMLFNFFESVFPFLPKKSIDGVFDKNKTVFYLPCY